MTAAGAAGGEEAAHALADTQHQADASIGYLPVDFSPEELAEGFLRGVPFHEIVAGFGKHWQVNSQATEGGRSWAYSSKVRRNRYFVSHSWRSAGWLKWLSLLVISNSLLAAVGGTLAAVATRVFYHYHTAPSILVSVQIRDATWEVPVIVNPTIAGMTAGLALFFQGHRLRQLGEAMGFLDPCTAFLDKLVIHQDNPALMKRGVALLGAFIKSSDVFLVLWSEHYLSRLWCSYEVAVFLHLQSLGHAGDIVVSCQPLTATLAAKYLGLVLSGIVFAVQAYMHGAGGVGGSDWLIAGAVSNVPATIFGAWALVKLHRDLATLEQQVAGYSLLNCQCFSEDDRATVEASVGAWFGASTKGKDVAIAEYDEFVRRRFSESMAAVFAEASRPPRCAAFCLALVFFWADTLSLVRPPGMPWKTYASLLANSVVQDLCGNMLAMAYQYRAIAWIERCFLNGRYTAVPQEERTEIPFNTLCVCTKFVVEVIAYWLAAILFDELAFAAAILPLYANICVSLGIVAWTAYEYS